ncbi:MAG: ParB/RepB/Spo0J family partition protein [Patescibacteria group bacterium]|nr:ParB/RepB/Spo0J family partition protein [Patescibacteria group bacterium]
MMKKGLGRGLDSLIPKKIDISSYSDFKLEKDDSLSLEKKGGIIMMIDPKKIKPNPYQPRKEFNQVALNDLMNSIKEHGILQPLVVSQKDGEYELIAGERRLRSSVELGLSEVPVIVREVDNQKKLELALIENLQRENLNPIDSAIAYNQLINEFNLTQDDLSKKLGKPRSSIANILRFLNLPTEIKSALASGQISEAHAKYLLGVEGEVKQLTIFRKIIYNNLSVRETDSLIRQSGGTKKAKADNHQYDVYQDKLQKHLNTKVEIKNGIKQNSINIFFYSEDDLKEIIKKIV